MLGSTDPELLLHCGRKPEGLVARFLVAVARPDRTLLRVLEWLANPVLVLLAAWVFSLAGKNKIALLLGILGSGPWQARRAGSIIT